MYYIKINWNVLHQLKKYAANENSTVKKTNQKTLMPLSNCAICSKKINAKKLLLITKNSTILIIFQIIS